MVGTTHLSSALSIWRPWRKRNHPHHRQRPCKNQSQKEIVIHRIKDPNLYIGTNKFDDEEVGIDDPKLYYDHGYGEHDNRVWYLATWKDEKTIIGKVEVLPDIYCYDDDDIYDYPVPILPGFILDKVAVAKKQKRKGVGTALLKRIERDIKDLVELMDLINRHAKLTGVVDHRSHLPLEYVELRLTSADSREALLFYRAMGYQFKPREDDDKGSDNNKHKSILWKLKQRLTWTWCWMSTKINDLICDFETYMSWNWVLLRVPHPHPRLVKRLDFHSDKIEKSD